MFVERIETRAYCRATEVPDRVVSAVLNVYPENLRPSVSVRVSDGEGHSGDRILIVESILTRKKSCESTLQYMIESLPDSDRESLRNSLDKRLDDRCTLFLRIDKQAAFLEDLRIARDPDVIAVRVRFKEYPRCERAMALSLISNILQSAGGKED